MPNTQETAQRLVQQWTHTLIDLLLSPQPNLNPMNSFITPPGSPPTNSPWDTPSPPTSPLSPPPPIVEPTKRGRLSPVLPFFTNLTPSSPKIEKTKSTHTASLQPSANTKVIKQLTSLVNSVALLVSCTLVPDAATTASLLQVCWDIGCFSAPLTPSETPSDQHTYLVGILKFVQALATTSSLPTMFLPKVLHVVTVAVNVESHASWSALNAILSTNPSQAIVGLIDVINTAISTPLATNEYNVAATRGAVFCLGMAMWGSKRVEGGRCYWKEAVEAMSKLIKVEKVRDNEDEAQ